jgi:hypothetical protein
MLLRLLRLAAISVVAFSAISCGGAEPTAPNGTVSAAQALLRASPIPKDAVASLKQSPAAPEDTGASTVATSATPSDAGAPAPTSVLVYSQPPSPDGGLIPSSLRAPDSSRTTQWAWDSFTFETVQTITAVRWRGAYDPAMRGAGGPVRDFKVDIYPSIPLGSEPDVAKGPLIRYEAGGNANETPAEIVGDVQMYDYSITLPVPFEAAPFAPYWVQIEATQSGNPDWALSKGTRGDSQHFRRILGGSSNIYQSAPGDAAFDLLALGSAGETAGGGVPAVPERVVTKEPLPPAEVVPINADGVQEVQLVISRSGYTPAHFAVKAGVPVRVVFRQLGYVPGGNILLVRWGQQQEQYLTLSSLTDKQVLEFTPQEPGDFKFNCTHDWYEGVMTVRS